MIYARNKKILSNKLFGNQAGATLLEAVISLFVFSIGVLGIAALQASTFVRGDDVKQRSLAIWKAQELVDRIRSTRTVDTPAGRINDYRTIVGNNVNAIFSYDQRGTYICPGTAPQRCDDTLNGTAISCSVPQSIAFDVWSVFCDPDSGASDAAVASGNDGANRLKTLDIALTPGLVAGESFLYLSWFSRSADQNAEIQGVNGAANSLPTELCGQVQQVDSRLDAYCVRFF